MLSPHRFIFVLQPLVSVCQVFYLFGFAVVGVLESGYRLAELCYFALCTFKLIIHPGSLVESQLHLMETGIQLICLILVTSYPGLQLFRLAISIGALTVDCLIF